MGDAADDVFDSAFERQAVIDAAMAKGAAPCGECHGKGWTRAYSRNEHESDECPVCQGFGWLDADGKPCEV